MKKFTCFFAALMVCAMSFAADYQKVTAVPTDWSGEYLLVYENSATEAYVWSGVDANNSYQTATIADGKISATDLVTITIAPTNGGKYSVVVNGGTNDGKYISGTADNNRLNFNATVSDNTLTFEKDGIKIESNTSVMRFNSAKDNLRFRYFKASSYTKQKAVQLYKKAQGEEIAATAIALDKETLELEQYRAEKLVATLTPAEATTAVVWTSSDENVATVSGRGLVSAVGVGTAVITATAGELKATCNVTVTEAKAITCAEAVEIAKTAAGNNVAAEGGKYVIRGYVTELAGKPAEDMEKFGNYSVWMADTKDGGKVFEAYQVKPADGKTIVAVGDYVEVVGELTKFNETYETMGKGTSTIKVITPSAINYTKEGAAKAVKVIENGQLVIIRDGVRYNAVGTVIE